MSLDIFQRSSGLIQVVGKSISSPRLLYRLRRRSAGILLSLCSFSVEPWEKPCITLSTDSEHAPVPFGIASLAGYLASRVPNWESLKVIALDKNHVNQNLSSGNHAPKTIISQSLINQSYCIK